MRPAELDSFYRRTLSSNLLADTLVLFRNNPGLVDTVDAVARRLGVSPMKLKAETDAMRRVGILKEEKISGFDILSFDLAADEVVSRHVGEKIGKMRTRKGKGKAGR